MPMTISSTPLLPATRISSSIATMVLSPAFERETLLADVLGVQVALHGLGSRQALEECGAAWLVVEGRTTAGRLEAEPGSSASR